MDLKIFMSIIIIVLGPGAERGKLHPEPPDAQHNSISATTGKSKCFYMLLIKDIKGNIQY